jgi:hypothetical protein
MDLSKLSRDDWILAGIAFLLVIDLLFLPWFDYTVGLGAFAVSATFSATGFPDGWLGVLAVLCALAIIGDLALDRLGTGQLPTIGGSRASTRLVLAWATAVFLGLKFIIHAHFSLFGFGFWAAAVLTIALLVVALRARQHEVARPARRPTSPP